MNQSYRDLTDKLGEPLWWDEQGVPRYLPFQPDLCNNIYAEEAVLYRICCQGCGHEFSVVDSWDRTAWCTNPNAKPLSDNIKNLHYGDPPNNGCCAAGPTMNCEDLDVLQFWRRHHKEYVRDGAVTDVEKYFEWRRIPELEITLMTKPVFAS